MYMDENRKKVPNNVAAIFYCFAGASISEYVMSVCCSYNLKHQVHLVQQLHLSGNSSWNSANVNGITCPVVDLMQILLFLPISLSTVTVRNIHTLQYEGSLFCRWTVMVLIECRSFLDLYLGHVMVSIDVLLIVLVNRISQHFRVVHQNRQRRWCPTKPLQSMTRPRRHVCDMTRWKLNFIWSKSSTRAE